MTEKSAKEFQVPKKVMKWVSLGLVLSSSVIIIISFLSGVTLADLAKLGYLTFALAALVSATRLPIQVLRFRILTVGLAGEPRPDLGGLIIARLASEFVSLSTPASSVGVFIRTAWLAGKGVTGGKALLIGYFEVLIEVYVGAGFALIAAAYAFTKGAVVIGTTIALVATLLIVIYTILFIVPAIRVIKVPRGIFTLASYVVGGPRAEQIYLRAVVGALNFSISARAIVRVNNLPLVIKTVSLTIVENLLTGTALWLVLNSAGLKIDPISSTLAASAVVAISQIPITIGGAGITELTMQSYLATVYGFASSWSAVVLWRIATYQVMLAITSIMFLLFVRKAPRRVSIGPREKVRGP